MIHQCTERHAMRLKAPILSATLALLALHPGTGSARSISAELVAPEPFVTSRPTGRFYDSDVISLDECKTKRGGFVAKYKSTELKYVCAIRPALYDSSKPTGGMMFVEKYECAQGNKYTRPRQAYESDHPDAFVNVDGGEIDSWCMVGEIDPRTMTPTSPIPKAVDAPTVAPPRERTLPEERVKPKSAARTQDPAPAAREAPPPSAFAPSASKPNEFQKPPALPPAPMVNPFKPPAILAKAQKQPISEACVTVIESRKVSSMCDFTSGVTMYANDIRIPAQYARECPSPVEFTFVDPYDGKENVDYATPRRHIVYSCGAPIQQVTVR